MYVSEAADSFADNTFDSYTQDLKDWMQYLEQFELDWTDAKVGDLVAYAKIMKNTKAPGTGKNYAPRTINRRTTTVRQFYEWASKYFSPTSAQEDHLLGIASSQDEYAKRKIKAKFRIDDAGVPVKVFTRPQAKQLLDTLGPAPSEREELIRSHQYRSHKRPSSRDRLGSEICLKVGLRLAEVCNLKLSQFKKFEKVKIQNLKNYDITVVGKGKKRRVAKFPGELITSILTYVNGERTQIVEAYSTEGTKGALILNSAKARKHAGKPLHRRTLERAFSNAVVQCGFTEVEERTFFKEESNGAIKKITTLKVVPSFVFHHLRHTFAVWLYYSLKLAGDSAPWLTVQARLGHAFLSTTMDIYLRAAADFEAEVTDRYMERTYVEI